MSSIISTVSAFELIKKTVQEIREFLAEFSAELRETKFPNTFLIKFSQDTKVRNPMINHLKGLIFNHQTSQICSLTYPVPLEVKELPLEEQEEIVKEISQCEYNVQEALDGTLLRLSYMGDDFPVQESELGSCPQGWLLSTNGKEDARQAFWMNGHSFFDQFWSTSPKIDKDVLNKDCVYLFLLCHPLNVIVVNHLNAKIYHVATYDRTTMKELVECQIGVEQPTTLELTVEEVQKKILESRDKPVASAGYMVTRKPDSNNMVHRYRFENFNYTKARDLRGDSNNVSFMLLGLILDKDQTKLDDFLQYYPIYQTDINSLQKRLVSLVAKFYREYGLRYKEHSNIFVHPRHHRFLNEIHNQIYLGLLKEQKRTVQYTDILNFVKDLPTAKVLYLLNYIYDMGHTDNSQ